MMAMKAAPHMFYFTLQEVQRAEEPKNDECKEVQQDGDVTVQSMKALQAETNSINNEVAWRDV